MFWKDRLSTQAGTKERNRQPERRGKFRFPLQRELRYKVLKDGVSLNSGAGHTSNISSCGVLFSPESELVPGMFIQLSISWPVLLDNTCAVRLIVFGRVIRNDHGQCACTIDKYEFRTQARGADSPVGRNDRMLERWAGAIRRDQLKERTALA